jgi:hypothetical protein
MYVQFQSDECFMIFQDNKKEDFRNVRYNLTLHLFIEDGKVFKRKLEHVFKKNSIS